jgi:F-type H+-transporting ATPase subunit a
VVVTFGLAMIVFVTVCIVGFWHHGLHFFSLFWPKDSNIFLGAFVFLIEFLSFLTRPFTLAIRLFANMTAGHVLLKVFGTFVVTLGSFGALPYVLGALPLIVVVALTALEVLIAVVQAYVFALLASLYLNDAVNLH